MNTLYVLSIRSIRKGAALVLAASVLAIGQVAVETDPGSGKIFHGRNSGTSNFDGFALYGENTPAPNWGVGVRGDGGYKGVVGNATVSGPGSRYGGHFNAAYGNGTNYGIYASATGAGSYAGYFSGNVTVSGTFSNPSDERLKRNVAALERPLAKILALRPATYDFDGTAMKVKGLPKTRQIGLMAGDIENVLPQLVQENPVDPGADGKESGNPPETYRSVNYIGLIPVLVGAIKEQQAQIEALKAQLKK